MSQPAGSEASEEKWICARPGSTVDTTRAPAASPTDVVLYTQIDNDTGFFYVSQDFETAFDTFDSEAADEAGP